MHFFSTYVKTEKIKEVLNVLDGKQAIAEVIDGFSVLISLERELLDFSADANDKGTNVLMSDYIRQQEKLVWMYSAYLNN